MKFIVENWFVIVAIAAVGGSIGYAIYSFVKMPSDKQLNKVAAEFVTVFLFLTHRIANWTNREQEQENSNSGMCTTCLWQGLSGLQRSSHSTCSA